MIFLVDSNARISVLMMEDYITLSDEAVRETYVFFSIGPAFQCAANILKNMEKKS